MSGGIYEGPNGQKLHGDGKPVGKPYSELAAPTGSPTVEPRVKTLLRSMMVALDRGDADTYWVTFGMLLSLHEEMMKSPNND